MPIPREVDPEEIAELVAFLCGSGGNYINGRAGPQPGRGGLQGYEAEEGWSGQVGRKGGDPARTRCASVEAVVGGLPGDDDIVDVAFLEARGGDPDETGFLLEFLDS